MFLAFRPTARLAPPRARRPWRLARRVVSGALGPASPRRQGTWRQPFRVAAQPAARGSAHTTWGAKVAPWPSYGVEGQCTYLLFSRAASRSPSATAPKQTWRDSGAPTPKSAPPAHYQAVARFGPFLDGTMVLTVLRPPACAIATPVAIDRRQRARDPLSRTPGAARSGLPPRAREDSTADGHATASHSCRRHSDRRFPGAFAPSMQIVGPPVASAPWTAQSASERRRSQSLERGRSSSGAAPNRAAGSGNEH